MQMSTTQRMADVELNSNECFICGGCAALLQDLTDLTEFDATGPERINQEQNLQPFFWGGGGVKAKITKSVISQQIFI